MFLNTQELMGEEIYLKLEKTAEENPAKGYVPAYYFSIHRRADGMRVGHCDLRIGHNENTKFGGNIGYSIDESYQGNHYAGKACLLLLRLASKHELGQVIITCDPINIASRKTCEFLDARFIEETDIPSWHEMYREGKLSTCRYEIEL